MKKTYHCSAFTLSKYRKGPANANQVVPKGNGSAFGLRYFGKRDGLWWDRRQVLTLIRS